MSALDGLATALQSVVGTEYLLTEAASAAYAIDGVLPAIVVQPADEAQVAAVMRLAHEHQATVFPYGGGNHMTLGHTPERVDVVLSLQRLQQQLAYEPADMTTTVQAGLRLVDLQQTLHRHGQFLALDPPAATATLGGMVAANLSGPRRLLYGTARDLLLGITVIAADGTRTKAGGRVVKNVTGYDLNKLYTGSLGTLGVITELTCKLHPLPPGEHTFGLAFSHHAAIRPMLHTLLQLPLRLNSLELLNAAAWTTLTSRAALAGVGTAYLLIVRVEGSPDVARVQEQRIVAALQHLSLTDALAVQAWSPDEQTRLWHGIEQFPTMIQNGAPQGVVSKVSLRLSDLAAFFQEMHEVSTGSAWPVLAHAGSGIAYVGIPADESVSDSARMLEKVQRLDACVARLHGRRVIEHAPVALKRHCEVWGPPGDDFALMRAIKTSFDPHNRLNPGRFIGGL